MRMISVPAKAVFVQTSRERANNGTVYFFIAARVPFGGHGGILLGARLKQKGISCHEVFKKEGRQ